jgi:hypothetical protein
MTPSPFHTTEMMEVWRGREERHPLHAPCFRLDHPSPSPPGLPLQHMVSSLGSVWRELGLPLTPPEVAASAPVSTYEYAGPQTASTRLSAEETAAAIAAIGLRDHGMTLSVVKAAFGSTAAPATASPLHFGGHTPSPQASTQRHSSILEQQQASA